MTADAFQKKSDGLKKVQNALWGLLLVLTSFLILKTIDPRFVEINEKIVDPLKTYGIGATNQMGIYLQDGYLYNAKQEYLTQHRALQASIDTRQKEIDDLNQQIAREEASQNRNEGVINALKKQRDEKIDLSNKERAAGEIVEFQAQSSIILGRKLGSFTYDEEMRQIEDKYNKAVKALRELGPQVVDGVEAKRVLDDQRAYTESMLKVQQICNEAKQYSVESGLRDTIRISPVFRLFVNSGAVDRTKERNVRLKNEVESQYSNISDPVLQTQLKNTVDSIYKNACP